jgi:predicted TIM-barrel fold metal-dependent hydrolase
MPAWAPGPAISMLAYAYISEDERRAIGGENLQRLLGAVR